MTLTTQQARRIAQALRRGGIDSLRIADALDLRGRTHFLIEVSDMGQFAQDWNSLKQIIKHADQRISAGPCSASRLEGFWKTDELRGYSGPEAAFYGVIKLP
jgi:hypothetical protein